MHKVRAKFKVTEIKQTEHWVANSDGSKPALDTVTFYPVSGPENETWAQATPGGNLTLTMSNPKATGFFKLGQCYFLDFTEAPTREADETK